MNGSTRAAEAPLRLVRSPSANMNVASQDVADRYRVSAQSSAEMLLARYRNRLLVVSNEDDTLSDLYVLHEQGFWWRGDNTLLKWLGKLAESLRERAVMVDRLDGKELLAMLARVRRLEEPDILPKIRKEAVAALDNLIEHETLKLGAVTTCLDTDLDANMRYLGCLNGVIDLHAGKLLEPDKARGALVTLRAPTEFDPNARHPVVDDLLGRMSAERRGHYLGALGNALRATPKRLYAVVCEPDCGKTTHLNLTVNTLGKHYAKVAAQNVIQQRKRERSSETQLTPGLTAWWEPTRVIFFDEVKESVLSPELVKDLTGGGLITARILNKNLKTKRATATTFLFSNEETVPQIGNSTDKGLRVRYRELRFPHIPDEVRDEGEIRDTLTADPDVRKAFLALLVHAAAQNPNPPEDTPEVREWTNARAISDAGELGTFAQRLVPDADSFVTFKEVWDEWCSHNHESTKTRNPGGISKRVIGRRLSAHVSEFPPPKVISKKGKKLRGWRGWRLLTVEESGSPIIVAERAVQDLIDAFPNLSEERREILRTDMSAWEKAALMKQYQNAYKLERTIKDGCTISEESTRDAYRGMTTEQRTAILRWNMVENLSITAIGMLSLSPACAKARERLNELKVQTIGRESVALAFLLYADWELDQANAPRHAEALAEKAVTLKDAELVRAPWKRNYYASDVDDAIKDLLGV